MGIRTSSVYFKLSIVCLIGFLGQLIIISRLIRKYVIAYSPTSHIPADYLWLEITALLWISLGGLFLYKTTKRKQTPATQLLVFIATPIVLMPLLAIIYVTIVLLPLYGLASNKTF
jgi:hypothetical protein